MFRIFFTFQLNVTLNENLFQYPENLLTTKPSWYFWIFGKKNLKKIFGIMEIRANVVSVKCNYGLLVNEEEFSLFKVILFKDNQKSE